MVLPGKAAAGELGDARPFQMLGNGVGNSVIFVCLFFKYLKISRFAMAASKGTFFFFPLPPPKKKAFCIASGGDESGTERSFVPAHTHPSPELHNHIFSLASDGFVGCICSGLRRLGYIMKCLKRPSCVGMCAELRNCS